VSSVLTLLFAPSLLFFINFYELKNVFSIYIIIILLLLPYTLIKKKIEESIILTIYLLLLLIAYFNNDFETVKFIPVLSATMFFMIFAHSTIKKKELIYKFTVKFYKKELSEEEIIFLKKSDFFWSLVIFIYAVFLLILVYIDNNLIWAFFSSIGWYIYFFLALSIQIIYGKLYVLKMPIR